MMSPSSVPIAITATSDAAYINCSFWKHWTDDIAIWNWRQVLNRAEHSKKERIPEDLTIITSVHNLSMRICFLYRRGEILKMTAVGDHVKCPQCGMEARVVWVSQDEKTMAVRCVGYHSHGENNPPPKTTSRYIPKPKRKYGKRMIFLTETTKKKWKFSFFTNYHESNRACILV